MPVAKKNRITFLPSKKMWVNLVKHVFPLCPKTFLCFCELCLSVGWPREIALSRAGGVPLLSPPGSESELPVLGFYVCKSRNGQRTLYTDPSYNVM